MSRVVGKMQAVDYVVRDETGRLFKGSLDAQAETLVLRVADYTAVSLNLSRDMVDVYTRVGDNLVIKLEDGREIVLENMFVAQSQGTQLYFSSGGEIYEISFSEAWGRTNYAHYGESEGTAGLVFSDGTQISSTLTGATTDVGYAVTQGAAQVETTMAAAPIFAGLGGGAAGLGAVGAGAVGVGLLAGGGGSSAVVLPVLARQGGISIVAAGGGDDQVINNAELAAGPVVSGQTYANSIVTVKLGDATRTTSSDADGAYTVAFNESDIADGETMVQVSASVINPDGEAETATADVKIDTITNVGINHTTVEGDGVILASETSDGVQVTGTSEAGATVMIKIFDATRTATVGEDGTWSVVFDGALFDGKNVEQVAITAETTDQHGNTATATQTVTVDTVLAVTIDNVQAGDNVINRAEADAGVSFTGTTDPGASVTVELAGTTIAATVAADGTWTATFPSANIPRTEVELTLNAHASDALGNAVSTSHVVSVDNTGMVQINETPLEIDDVVNLTEQADGVTVTGTTTPGSTVQVSFHNFTGPATVDANGNWFVNVPASGIDTGEYDVTIVATATTASGNVSTDSEIVRIDTLVNQLALDGGNVAGDNFINSSEYVNGVALTGTVEPGSVVNVTLAGITKLATVDVSGNWTVTFMAADIPDGDYQTTMVAEAVDPAGNTHTISQSVNVDTIAANLNLAAVPIEGDNTVNATEASDGLEITGSADPGMAITVMLNGVAYTTTSTAEGTWTVFFTPADIGTGELTAPLIVQTTDAAGNVTRVESELEVDTVVTNFVPEDSLTGDNTVNAAEATQGVPLTGTGEPGSSVTIAFNNQEFTGTVGVDGTWTVLVPTTAIPTGELTIDITTTIVDLAGNVLVDTATADIDTLVNNLVVTSTSMDGQTVLNAFVAQTGINLVGSVEPGSTVVVTFENTTKAANVDAAGNWTVTFQGDEVRVGEYTTNAVIVATDAAGNTLETTSQFVIDTSVPDAPRITAFTEGEDGVRSIAIRDDDQSYSVSAVNDAATDTFNVAYNLFRDTDRDELLFSFRNDLAFGTDLIVELDDAAGNQSSTLLVMDTDDNPNIDMGDAAYNDFSIQAVDLVFASDANLTITAEQLENLSDLSDSLLVRGGTDDSVTAIGAVDTNETQTIQGEVYNVYTLGDNGAYLMIDPEVNVITTT